MDRNYLNEMIENTAINRFETNLLKTLWLVGS